LLITYLHWWCRSFNLTFLYSDDVLSLNNSVDRTCHIEPEIKDTTDTDMSASYLDLHLEIDRDWRLRTELSDTEMISIFPLWTFHLYVATFQQHIYISSIYLSDDTIYQSLWLLSGYLNIVTYPIISRECGKNTKCLRKVEHIGGHCYTDIQ
jgi:hypothetical protein